MISIGLVVSEKTMSLTEKNALPRTIFANSYRIICDCPVNIPSKADQYSQNVCEMFTFHMQIRSAANYTLS